MRQLAHDTGIILRKKIFETPEEVVNTQKTKIEVVTQVNILFVIIFCKHQAEEGSRCSTETLSFVIIIYFFYFVRRTGRLELVCIQNEAFVNELQCGICFSRSTNQSINQPSKQRFGSKFSMTSGQAPKRGRHRL